MRVNKTVRQEIREAIHAAVMHANYSGSNDPALVKFVDSIVDQCERTMLDPLDFAGMHERQLEANERMLDVLERIASKLGVRKTFQGPPTVRGGATGE